MVIDTSITSLQAAIREATVDSVKLVVDLENYLDYAGDPEFNTDQYLAKA
jgi:hypothetical protein